MENNIVNLFETELTKGNFNLSEDIEYYSLSDYLVIDDKSLDYRNIKIFTEVEKAIDYLLIKEHFNKRRI